MRFMVMIKATADTEAGVLPSRTLLTEMGRYNEELVRAGVLLAGEGLHPTSRGARVMFSAGGTKVTDGPFRDSDLVAGFWLLQTRSRDEAVEWARRIPNPDHQEVQVEVRQVFEAADFGDGPTEQTGVRAAHAPSS